MPHNWNDHHRYHHRHENFYGAPYRGLAALYNTTSVEYTENNTNMLKTKKSLIRRDWKCVSWVYVEADARWNQFYMSPNLQRIQQLICVNQWQERIVTVGLVIEGRKWEKQILSKSENKFAPLA